MLFTKEISTDLNYAVHADTEQSRGGGEGGEGGETHSCEQAVLKDVLMKGSRLQGLCK